jgi:hypothetical protein
VWENVVAVLSPVMTDCAFSRDLLVVIGKINSKSKSVDFSARDWDSVGRRVSMK